MAPYENVIIGNSFEEIVFANRNKDYGAYMLRKKQKGYLIIAFLAAFLFVTSSVVTPLIYNYIKGNGQTEITPVGPVVAEIDTTLMINLPEPPKINIDQSALRFVPPQVVADADSSEDPFAAMERILASNTFIAPPPIGDQPEVEDPIEVEPPIHMVVEEPAKFNGGDIHEFNKWVLKNMNYPQLAVENQISGRVTVQFVVNAKGKVESATILRGVDVSLDEEALRVIRSSPFWTPPKQGGRPVKQLFTLPVNFQLQDNN